MAEEISVEKYISRARSFGLNVFFGSVSPEALPVVYWDNNQGDFVKFMKVAKDSGATMIIVNLITLENEDIDDAKLNEQDYPGQEGPVRELNSRLEGFRQYVGRVGMIELSWIKEGVAYSYIESVPWADDFTELLSAVDEFVESYSASQGG